MRVIAGKARGMRLECPPGTEVRPLADRAREALFNILRDRVEGANVLDLFAGAGTVGIEALSRGAPWCVFVERSPKTRDTLEENLAHTRLAEFCDVLQRDAFRCVEALQRLGRKFDIVYMGPPFALWRDPAHAAMIFDLLDALAENGLLNRDCLAVVQHDTRDRMPDATSQFRRVDRRDYGTNALSFYDCAVETADESG